MEQRITNGEILATASGLVACAATDLKLFIVYGGALAAFGALRRSAWVQQTISEQLAVVEYDPEQGRPPWGNLLAALPIWNEEADPRAVQPAPKGKPPRGGTPRPGRIARLAAHFVEEPAVVEVEARSKPAPKPPPADPDAEWVRQAGGDAEPKPPKEPKVLGVRGVCERLNKNIDDFPHVLVVGNSGAGKTTLVQLLVGTRPGQLVILDPKRPKGWEGPKWGGLPYVSRDKETASYAPMVAALKAVCKEMDDRYRTQDERSEPFGQLTVVLDEAKNSVEECPELAELYRRIVSIGREVGVRLVLISTSDRARKLGFDGEADSMDSFAWLQLGEFALRVRPELKERGPERYRWAVADFFGEWTAFENEKAWSLLQSLALARSKAWGRVRYNCQAERREPGETAPMRAYKPARTGDAGYAASDTFLAEMFVKYGGSVKGSADGSANTNQGSASALPSALPTTSGQQDADFRTSVPLVALAAEVQKAYDNVPEAMRGSLRNALRVYARNGRLVTPAIRETYGHDGGRSFTALSAYLKAALAYADNRQRERR